MKTKTATHTPGRWGMLETKDFGGLIYYHIASADTNVGAFYGRRQDANLITAAPELLDALKALVIHWASLPGTAGQGTFGASIGDKALAAIAKAEGREVL